MAKLPSEKHKIILVSIARSPLQAQADAAMSNSFYNKMQACYAEALFSAHYFRF